MSSKTSEGAEKKGGVAYGGTHRSPLTYNSYLKVHDLKNLQICQSEPPHHDEPLFIVIHQTYELWFKLILHELDCVVELIKKDKPRRANFYMKRVVQIMKTLVNQIHILETMTPKDFLGFRSLLNPASGFQSSQFREIEFMAGLRDKRMLEHFQQDEPAYGVLVKRFEDPSLGELFYDMLERDGFRLPRDNGATGGEEHSDDENTTARIMELKKIYDDPDKYADYHDLAESFLDLDELILLWRNHHVVVVERIIGFKRGTGGSEGVGYLRSTLSKKCFPDLWKLRTCLEV